AGGAAPPAARPHAECGGAASARRSREDMGRRRRPFDGAPAGEMRRAVIEALVAERDPRVVPMLVRIIEESEPPGKDHEVVLETIEALGLVPSDAGVAALARVIARRGFFGRRKLRTLKERGVGALARIGTPAAQTVLANAAKTGDRLLRKIAAARR